MTSQKKNRISVAIASDHAGFELKEFLRTQMTNVDWLDLGPASTDRTDYPDYAKKVALKVVSKECDLGVLICGSGIGMSIAANKVNGIRAAHVETDTSAKLARAHNNANILCIGARLSSADYAKQMVEAWLQTPFEGGRHQGRIEKIANLERGHK